MLALNLHNCEARCSEVNTGAAPVQMWLFSNMVDLVLSYGTEVWGLQLAAQAAASPQGSSNSAAEKLQLSFRRRLLARSAAGHSQPT